MAYPAGVSLAVVNVGTAFTAFGDGVPVNVVVTPRFPKVGGGFLTRVIHAASGWVMTGDSDTFTGQAGGELSFSIPHVDQAGWRDPAQNAYTGWYYEITVTVGGAGKSKASTKYTQTVQPLIGQALIDLDLVPDGPVGEAASAPVPEVLSVNGQTGAVQIDVGQSITDPDIALLVQDSNTATGAALSAKYIATGSAVTAVQGITGNAEIVETEPGVYTFGEVL